jgi:hypothetical protein
MKKYKVTLLTFLAITQAGFAPDQKRPGEGKVSKKSRIMVSEAVLLRQKAEKLLKKQSAKTGSHFTETDNLKLIHELEVHQIELEMQNEELMLAKQQAEQSGLRAKREKARFFILPFRIMHDSIHEKQPTNPRPNRNGLICMKKS